MKDRVLLWLALGFGSGRLPKAPGTFGSVLGLFWLLFVFSLPSVWLALVVVLASIPAGAWICTEAERILNQHDPGCIVIDEILALPVAGLGWVTWRWGQGQSSTFHPWPSLAETVLWLVTIFILFRIFDIAKPWPVGVSQKLPKGWGVMADDVLAGAYVAVISFVGRWGISIV